ncbi:GrdX family protein [Enterococcus devriesei]|uniref:GrdX family protein n=1 Tax=Enterococcus devriesei TaxID=319970 RepID=UPI0028902C57|nr:GrdX family protein [Enterococcus devriesei]MDT2820157.1 GrdX family protein [Enterococcus devriesei]
MIIVTNNPMVKEQINQLKAVDFVEGSYGEVLSYVKRRVIDERLYLLSHPLSGSIKPNETYYKTIFLTETNSQSIDLESLEYMESAIAVYEKFIKNKQRPNWSLGVLQDFAFVDFYIAQSTLDRIGGDTCSTTCY